MKTKIVILSIAILGVLFCCKEAYSQTAGVLTFTAANTTGNGSVTPVLSWSTTPVATSCTASGGWTGPKAASGTETLPEIISSATYNLACTWTDNQAKVSWTLPTKNMDGSTLTDLKGVRIYYGTSATTMTTSQVALQPLTTKTITSLASGTWFFSLKSYNMLDIESAGTPPVSKLIGSASGSKQLGITVNPIPNAPTNVTVE